MNDLKKMHFTAVALVTALALVTVSCSAPQVREESPEERLDQARTSMEKHRYEAAQETLEDLKFITAGTRLGGEVQFLLAETRYRQGKLSEAEVGYGTYLLSYPGGPFAEKALFYQALSKVRQLEKMRLGFFSIKRYLPHDRDISIIREARVLFQRYLETYPGGEWVEEADERVTELLTKEGEHELGIASFYLNKDKPQAALARTGRVLQGPFPDPILDRARKLAGEADAALPDAQGGSGH
ncbi:MAG: outer membrane protein assembly factor BamD [bacterium]|nr:outer membrane protein assembly factor BamD [bacterium]